MWLSDLRNEGDDVACASEPKSAQRMAGACESSSSDEGERSNVSGI